MILMSPHPHPSKALQGDRRSWRKKINYSYQPGKNVAKSGVIAAGKMLKKYFQMDHYQMPSKRETSSSSINLESNLYLVSKLFCDPLLKLRLLFFILLPRSWKSN